MLWFHDITIIISSLYEFYYIRNSLLSFNHDFFFLLVISRLSQHPESGFHKTKRKPIPTLSTTLLIICWASSFQYICFIFQYCVAKAYLTTSELRVVPYVCRLLASLGGEDWQLSVEMDWKEGLFRKAPPATLNVKTVFHRPTSAFPLWSVNLDSGIRDSYMET